MDLGPLVAIFGVILGTVLAIVLSAPYIRQKRKQATITLLNTELEVEREARIAQEERCKRELSELRGEISGLRIQYAQTVGIEVMKFLRDELGVGQ